jgi:ABC-type nitrate/sulfonate/bicarbonate transport system permease component
VTMVAETPTDELIHPADRSTWVRLLERYLPPAVLICAVIVLWQWATGFFKVQSWLLPAPTAIFTALHVDWPLIHSNILATIEETLIGFCLALFVGITLALLIHYSMVMEHALYPWIIASQTVPTIAIAPILVVWFGYNLTPKILVVALFCFFPIVVSTVDGLNAADTDMMSMMRTLGASRWNVFRYVEFPGALPAVFAGLKIAITFSVIGAVLGEWVGSTEGLGYLLLQSTAQFQTARGFAILAVLSAMGITLFITVSLLQRLLMPWWREETKRRAGAR